jgi:3-oxoacyl-[acyl-carrier protein] reductase
VSRPGGPGAARPAAYPPPPELTTAAMAAAFDLRDRRALVTGAASPMGRATALALAAAGATVLACHAGDLDNDETHRAEKDSDGYALDRALKETGGDHRVVQADVSHSDGVATLIRVCREHLGTVQILVNAVGPTDRVPFSELTPRQWRHALGGGLTAAAMVTHAVLPLLLAGASVVNIGATVDGRGEGVAGATAAAGLAGLTRSLARELGPDGIRANLVSVGPAASSQVEQVAAVVLFLASAEAGGVTGETFVVDGGQ